MKNHRRSSKNQLVAYLGVPVLFIALAILLYYLGGQALVDMTVDEFKLAAIKGAPEYSYEVMSKEVVQQEDGSKNKGEGIRPSVGNQFGQLSCEAIGLEAPLYYGDSKEELTKGIGVYVGSSLPGEGSTIIAGGHDTTFCKPLEHIEIGSILKVSTIYGDYTYKVTKIDIADVMDATAYQVKTTTETMILYTCYPFGEINSNRSQRFYVYAEKSTGTSLQEE